MGWWEVPKDIARFESKYVRGSDDECWPWIAGTDQDGYGIFWAQRRTGKAHRAALARKLGRDLESGEWALHRCDNPPCVNPAHLRAGDLHANVKDMVDRERAAHPNGELHGCAVLTEADVREIRRLCALPKPPRQWQIAQQFGITQPTVSNIKHRQSWSHLK